MDMSKYRDMFLSETREHLDKMNKLLVALERQPDDREGIDALFREAHSIKGMAASMGYPVMTSLAHQLEDFLDGFRSAGSVPGPAVDHLLAGFDLLEKLLEDIAADRPERSVDAFPGAPGPETSPPKPVSQADERPAPEEVVAASPPLPDWDIRLRLQPEAIAPTARALLAVKDLETLGTLLSSRPTLAELGRGGPLRELSLRLRSAAGPDEIEAQLAGMPDLAAIDVKAAPPEETLPRRRREDNEQTVRVKTELLDRFISLTGELITNRYHLQDAFRQGERGSLKDGLDRLSQLLVHLHHQVLQVRMMPLESITGRLPRMLRELCRTTGKQVELELSGTDIELDRAILERLADPLVHMLRNAVDHGIAERGLVTLSAWREKDLALLEMTDDGRGIDLDRVRAKALEKGLITAAQAQQLSFQETLMLICRPGFSTAEQVSETSGRGVGMDVVKAAVESLGGSLEISLPESGGTRVLLRLPLSVAIIQVLLIDCDGKLLGLPISRVERVLDLERDELQMSGRQMLFRYGEEALPLVSLRKVLRLPGRKPGATLPVVVTAVRGRKVGLVVDRLVGQQEVFVKSLEFPLNQLSGISGATVLGSGQVVFLLDPPALLEAVRTPSEPALVTETS